jgi:hypothetical protein
MRPAGACEGSSVDGKVLGRYLSLVYHVVSLTKDGNSSNVDLSACRPASDGSKVVDCRLCHTLGLFV